MAAPNFFGGSGGASSPAAPAGKTPNFFASGAQPTVPGVSEGGIPVAPGVSDPNAAPAVQQHHHHWSLHGLLHGIPKDIGQAAHDIKSMPGGLLKVGTDLLQGPLGSKGGGVTELAKEWRDAGLFLTTAGMAGSIHTYKGDNLIHQDVPGALKGTRDSILHPGRDPFMTLLTVAPGANGLGKLGIVAREGALDMKAGSTFGARTVSKIADDGTRVSTNLHASVSPLMRGAQHLHDSVIQKAIDKRPNSRIASYGNRRIGYAITETHRYLAKTRSVIKDELEAGTKGIKKEAKATGLAPVNLQDAIRLTSENELPKNAYDFHIKQAHQGIEPAANAEAAARMKAVEDAGIVKLNSAGHVVIDAEKFPRLAEIDANIAKAQQMVDHVAKKHLGMSDKALQARIDGPNKIRAGGHFVTKGEAANEAGWARSAANREAEAILHQAKRDAKRAGKEAVEHASAAGAAERIAFKLRTQLTAGEKEAIDAAKVVDKHAERASRTRAKYAEAADQAATLAPKVERQTKVVADLLRSKASPSKVAHEKGVLADLLAQHEKVAGLAKAHEQAFGAGQRLAAVQRGVDEPALAKVTGAAEAQAKAADLEHARRIGLKEDALARAKSVLATAHDEAARVREEGEAHAQSHLAHAEKIIGPAARKGRNYIDHAVTTKVKGGGAAFSPHVGPVVGDLSQTLLGPKSKRFTGRAMQLGGMPTNTLEGVVAHVKDAIKYVNSDAFRRDIVRYGTRTKQTDRDILVRVPDTPKGQITAGNRIELGQAAPTMNHAESIGTVAGYQEWLSDMIPSLRSDTADARLASDGVAPDGYVWIDKGIVGDLAKPLSSSSKIVGKIDDVNALVTAMTVYFKLGHIGTRVLTNATTNLIQGVLKPNELKHAITMWKATSENPTLRRKLLALTGQGSYESLPAEGMSKVAVSARWGAKQWAHFADARFRFNSIVYEAKKAGYDTPEKLSEMVDKLEHPQNHPTMDAAEHAKIDWVVKRADRAAIAYDRLTVTEKRFLARGIWFYPWVKGSSSFFLHFLTEHPAQALVAGQAGFLGRKQQFNILGDLPSYESGLIPLGGGSHPTVTDFSTFSPFSTPADVASALSNPSAGEIAGMASPVLGALDSLVNGQNEFGQKSKTPVQDAMRQLFAPTPELQIAFPGSDKPSRMFRHNRTEAFKRFAVGPAAWRRINLTAAHQSAARERAGK